MQWIPFPMSKLLEAIALASVSAEDQGVATAAADGSTQECNSKGAYHALFRTGKAIDTMMTKGHIGDIRDVFLSERHTKAYCRLEVESNGVEALRPGGTPLPFNAVITLNLSRKCDLVNCIDLVFHDPEHRYTKIDSLLKSLRVDIGGQTIDRISCDATLFDAVCAVHKMGPGMSRRGDKVIVPLPLAPFHKEELLALCGLEHHGVQVHVTFADGVSVLDAEGTDIQAYGDAYYLVNKRKAMEYEMRVSQLSYISVGSTVEGGGASRHKVGFNHPCTMLMFWGGNHADGVALSDSVATTVTNVGLFLDGASYYDGPLWALERNKEKRGLGGVRPTCFFFSDEDPRWSTQGAVNFTMFDNVELVIETVKGTPSFEVWVAVVSVQPLRITNGFGGLAFSK